MTLLQFLGQEGQTDASQRDVFFICKGCCQLYRERVVKALMSVRGKYINWPDLANKYSLFLHLGLAVT